MDSAVKQKEKIFEQSYFAALEEIKLKCAIIAKKNNEAKKSATDLL